MIMTIAITYLYLFFVNKPIEELSPYPSSNFAVLYRWWVPFDYDDHILQDDDGDCDDDIGDDVHDQDEN